MIAGFFIAVIQINANNPTVLISFSFAVEICVVKRYTKS